ncbi:MAG TPA: hypothetical protein VHR47_03645 [Bacillota bacterium]|nr:hypothetical protein [Bacillota bacterium]
MIKRNYMLLAVLISFLFIPSISLARDFFMFDLEKNKILHMGSNDTAFVAKMDIEKVPDLIIQTSDPNKFLAVYMPKGKTKFDGLNAPIGELREEYQIYKETGCILLINIATGRTEDVVDIGYGPFRTCFSKDKKHFFISYRPNVNSKVFELLHYNAVEKKKEVLNKPLNRVIGLDVSMDTSSIYALVKRDGNDSSEMLTISMNPLSIKSALPAGFNPFKAYVMSANRVVLLDTGGRNSSNEEVWGSIQLIDTDKNEIIAHAVFKPSNVSYQWYKEQNTLFVVTRDMSCKWNEQLELVWSGHFSFIRVNLEGLKNIDKSEVIWDYQYHPKTDTIYALPERGMVIYDLRNGKEGNIKTGINIYNVGFKENGQDYIRTMNYFVNVVPEANLATVYSNYSGIVKFYNLMTGKLIQTVKGAKMKKAIPEDYGDKASVTTNSDKTRFYVLNRVRKGLTVFDQKMEQIATIDLSDQRPISMYQVEKPTYQTILATDKGLYKVEDNALKEICRFTGSSKGLYLFKDDQRLIFWTEKDWYIIDSATLEMKYHLDQFGDPNDKYTKVQKGECRYYYVPTPDQWGE